MSTYTLTLCNPDGSLMAVIPDAPVLPRFLHVTPDAIQLADSDTPKELAEGDPVMTFRRVASSVWVHDDEFNVDDRDALFVRCVTWD